MPKFMDLTGQRFGRWIVKERAPDDKNRVTRWHCRCDCGNENTVYGNALKNGRSSSCGCRLVEVAITSNTTHGLHKSSEYKAWDHMVQRCTNPNNENYKHYGGRGIRVCDRWGNSFENFYADMGPSNGLTLDRRNNDGHYEPGNCRWVDWTTQRHNQRMRSNNKTGTTGVSQNKDGTFRATFVGRKEKTLDRSYDNINSAIEARLQAEEDFHFFEEREYYRKLEESLFD